jgi:hypothetical protein
MNTILRITALALLVATSRVGYTQQQSSSNGEFTRGRAHGPVRVAIVAADGLNGSKTEVVRRASQSPREVVLVAADASEGDLADALKLLAALRHQYGDSLTRDLRAKVSSSARPPSWNASESRSWMLAQLARLQGAKAFRVNGIGTARTIWITLPEAYGRVVHSDSAR